MKPLVRSTIAFGLPALVVLGVSAAVTLHTAARNAGPRSPPKRFSGSTVVQRLPSLLAAPRLPETIVVAVVRDEAAATYYPSPAAFDSIIAAWRDALRIIGANVRVLPSSAARDDRAARVVIVPSSPCLTIATREAIENARARGAGVILTGASGTYDAGCRPLGYGLIVALTGASRAAVLEPREMTYVSLPTGSPLSPDIPPGARVDLNPGRQVALRHRTRDAFYAEYGLEPNPAHRQLLLDAAVTHAVIDGRRAVYWGFEIADVVKRPWDRAITILLLRNSVAWAAGVPLATIEPWPLGKRAAASLAQDVESGFGNARYAVDSLRAAGVRSSFYLTSALAQRYQRLSRRMAESGEVGTHSDNHQLLGGTPSADQRERLSTTQRELRQIVGAEVKGLRPPEEQFDTATMTGWLSVNGSYLFGANDSRSAAPELLRFGRDTLVLVGRVGSDDFAGIARRVPIIDSLVAMFLSDYDRLRSLGGHYVLSYHSQVLAKPELVPALARVARRLASDTAVWTAPVGDVADWWRARASLEANVRIVAGRLRVTIRNRSTRDVRDAVVRIELPEDVHVVRSGAQTLPGDSRTLRLVVPPLPAGEVVRLEFVVLRTE